MTCTSKIVLFNNNTVFGVGVLHSVGGGIKSAPDRMYVCGKGGGGEFEGVDRTVGGI